MNEKARSAPHTRWFVVEMRARAFVEYVVETCELASVALLRVMVAVAPAPFVYRSAWTMTSPALVTVAL